MRAPRRRAKSACRSKIAACRDEHVDDLTVLINGSVHVPPPSRDFRVGLVDIPTVTHQVAARPGRVCEEWGEALHPPVDRDVVDLDPTLTEQFLDRAVGDPVPQIPAHGKDDDLRREPKDFER